MRAFVWSFLLLMILAGCGGQSVVPPDRFYRLPAVDAAGDQHAVSLNGSVVIDPVEAGPLYQERPMLFSTDPDGLRLEQHNYHHWAESPARLIRRFTFDTLSARGIDTRLESPPDTHATAYRLASRLLRFERHESGASYEAVVAIHYRLSSVQDGRVLLDRHYKASVPIADRSPLTTAKGLRDASGQVMETLVKDLSVIGQ